MAKPFDATTKALVDAFPQDWLDWLKIPVTGLRLLDSDLAAISAASDRLIQFETPVKGIVHLELQASHDAGLLNRIHSYNVLAKAEYGCPVITVLILLRKEANQAKITGTCRWEAFLSDCYNVFGYRVVRLWEQTPETFLLGRLGTLPLAPLTAIDREELLVIVQQTTRRIQEEAEPGRREELIQATALLMGLKFSASLIREVMKGVTKMKESVVYQSIFADGVREGQRMGQEEGQRMGQEEGEIRARRDWILRLGRKRFGESSAEVVRWLESVSTREALDAIADRLLEVETWDELRG